ncbi:MAG: protein kinase domain-containing protein [Myxococcales bacterium]|jgi:serine/threonine protein kinase
MADKPAPYEIGTILGGKYRLERVIGQGGMGAVYEAENLDIGRRVAVKVLHDQFANDPDILARFRTEARAATAIGHPGIVEIIDLGTAPNGGAFLVMELLEGETLGARLRTAGRLDLASAGWIVAELLDAIDAAHRKGVVHRDLKPDNVFLVAKPAPAVKVLDFGISKFRPTGDVALTRTGVVMGTPAYMSPEQARGAKNVGPEADLYSVGAIFYEALAGSPAFPGESYNEILAKVLTEPHRPLGELGLQVPGAIIEIIDALLAKDPAKRLREAASARARLLEALAQSEAEPLGSTVLRPGPASRPDFSPTAPKVEPKPCAPALPPASVEPAQARPASSSAAVDASFVVAPKRKSRWLYWTFGVLLLWGACGMCRAIRDTTRDVAKSAAAIVKLPPRIEVSEQRAAEGEEASEIGVESGKDGTRVNIGFGGLSLVSVEENGKNTRVAFGGRELVNVTEGGEPEVVVTLVATPETATWRVDDKPLDCTGRCQVSSARGSVRSVVASAPGFAQTRLKVAFDQPREVAVELTKLEVVEPESAQRDGEE